ncbi:MAG: sugar ABC transporter permease [Chloroflexia bacterium]|nr:sugar ABC transporter permease [Chloroflexia bacterium]
MPRLSYGAQLWLLLTPFLLGISFLVLLPALLGLPLAFTAYNALEPPVFVGLDNFVEMAGDRLFWLAIFNSLFYVALAVPLRIAGALIVALLLFRRMRGGGAYRAAFYLPSVVPDIAWALLWLWVFNPIYGPLNQFLAIAGIPGPAWMVEEYGARFAIVFMMVWQIGEGLVVCLAALGDIPGETLEQSAVDGASAWQSLWRITLPLLAPILLILLMRDTVFSLQANFVPALIVGRGGGPNYATTFLPMYVYTNAFDYLRFGYAAAMTWSMYLLTALILLGQYRVAVRWRLGFRDAE